MEYLYKVCEISVKYHTNEESDKKLFVKTKEDAVKILRGFMQEDIELEEMTYGVILGPSLKVIGCINIGRGDLTSCVINSKKLISACLLCNGNAVIMAHNHPSGNLEPSSADIRMAKKLDKACSIMDIQLIDTIILTKDNANSFIDKVKWD